MQLDQKDKQILRELQKNARISNLELADKVNLSPTPCARRVKQLEDAGIITEHVTLLDRERLGLNLMAMISITMDRHTADRFENFEQAAALLPEVMECYVVTGQDSDFGVHSSFVLRQPINKHELAL